MTNEALLISIRPRFVENIFSGSKDVELRRVKPRVTCGDLVVIYASGETKGIVGAFEVAGLTTGTPASIWLKHNGGSGLSKSEFDTYFAGCELGYAIQIGRIWRLQSPIMLGTLRARKSGFRPPQSYHYWKLDDLFCLGGTAFSAGVKRITSGRSAKLTVNSSRL